ncbi:MAG: hypothetical protein LBU73_02340 [Helicobacteraceae bacterium]|nr:hypothetical protein [Helicobacteraceae bacterium]
MNSAGKNEKKERLRIDTGAAKVQSSPNRGVIIQPLIGIIDDNREIKFGISQNDLKAILGKPFRVIIDNILNQTKEIRSSSEFIFEKKKLVNIDFFPNVDLFINNINLFETENVIEKLSEFDFPTKEWKNGYINFYNLGISMGGFGKRKIPEKKVIRIFSKERIQFYEFFLKV